MRLRSARSWLFSLLLSASFDLFSLSTSATRDSRSFLSRTPKLRSFSKELILSRACSYFWFFSWSRSSSFLHSTYHFDNPSSKSTYFCARSFRLISLCLTSLLTLSSSLWSVLSSTALVERQLVYSHVTASSFPSSSLWLAWSSATVSVVPFSSSSRSLISLLSYFSTISFSSYSRCNSNIIFSAFSLSIW